MAAKEEKEQAEEKVQLITFEQLVNLKLDAINAKLDEIIRLAK